MPTLHTARLTLVPLADEHLELEIELDSDPEVMRYLTGRAATRAEVEAAHRRRMAVSPGFGFWMGFMRRGLRRLVDPAATTGTGPAFGRGRG